MTTLEERIADAAQPFELTVPTCWCDDCEPRERWRFALTAAVLAVLRDTPPDELAKALGMEQVGWYGRSGPGEHPPFIVDMDDVYEDDVPVFRFVRPVTGEADNE